MTKVWNKTISKCQLFSISTISSFQTQIVRINWYKSLVSNGDHRQD